MMRDRRNVLMVFFDLPATSKKARKAYRDFIKFLKNNGYLMMQESVYIKLLHYDSNAAAEISDVEKNAPAEGNVMVMKLSYSQFSKMKQIRGAVSGMACFDISGFSENFLCI